MRKIDSTWYAFLVMTVVVVGLTGVFATYAAPIPLQRALQRDATLNAAREVLAEPEPQAALEKLRPRLGDSAASLFPFGGDMAARIEAERLAMHVRLERDAAYTASRLRMLLGVVTTMAAVFAACILGIAARSTARQDDQARPRA
ncbi:MAG: hypothetical protein NT133_21265 [Alphaproteobacteria bacterium]|nr:hypothetical protein [Alphaproteobacteria bacterium]